MEAAPDAYSFAIFLVPRLNMDMLPKLATSNPKKSKKGLMRLRHLENWSPVLSVSQEFLFIFFFLPKPEYLIFMMSPCNMNFNPNITQRDVQCNWDGKRKKILVLHLSACTWPNTPGNPLTCWLMAFPNFGDTASQRLKNILILRRLVEQICYKGGFCMFLVKHPLLLLKKWCIFI